VAKILHTQSDDDFINLLLKRETPSSGRSPGALLDGVSASVAQPRKAKPARGKRESGPATPASFSEKPKTRPYQPLDSVWHGEEDAELIERLLAFYPRREPRLILDATVNGRRFWRGSTRPVIGLDVEQRHRPDVCADNTAMPFRSGAFDVAVYDPPHIPNQGHDRSKDFNTRFGLGARSDKTNGYTFAHTYPAFMTEAWRVLSEEGVLLCKIVDYVHNHRYQWAHVDLIRAGEDAGFTPCDCIIKVRKGPIIDPKWKLAHHTRRQHCYWIVFRKSAHCE
jgi:hypothetical protein